MIERTQLTDMMAMSDADVLGGAGQLDTARTNSPLQLILDNEIFGIAQRLRQGLTVDDEMFDWDELMGDPEELADGFIVTEHTLRHYADATRPELFNRGGLLSPAAPGRRPGHAALCGDHGEPGGHRAQRGKPGGH